MVNDKVLTKSKTSYSLLPTPYSLLLGLILLAFGLRLYRLDAQSLRGDEAASATYASLPAAEILEITRVADPHPPLFYLALGGWERLAGVSEFAVRFWVLVPALLLVPSVYVAARRLAGGWSGVVAALLIAVNSFHIWHSQDVRSYTWFALLGLWASIFLWQAAHGHRWRDWTAYTLTTAVLFYVHYYAVFLVVCHGLYLLYRLWVDFVGRKTGRRQGRSDYERSTVDRKDKPGLSTALCKFVPLFSLRGDRQIPDYGATDRDLSIPGEPYPERYLGNQALSLLGTYAASLLNYPLVAWCLSIFLAGLVFLPWMSMSWRFVTGFTGDFEPAMPRVVLWRGLQAFGGGLVAEMPQFLPWMFLPALLAAMGLLALWRTGREAALFLLLYLALPFVGIMILTLRGQAFTERYLMVALPPYVIFTATGLTWLVFSAKGGRYEVARRGNKLLREPLRLNGLILPALALVLIVWLNLSTLTQYHTDPNLAKSPQWRQLFEHIARLQDPATDILIYNFPEAAISYYVDTRQTTGLALPAFLVPSSPNPEPAEVSRHLTGLLAGAERVWFVPVNFGNWDDADLVKSWLYRYADLAELTHFQWIRVELYLTPTEIERAMQPQPVDFAAGITLRGFRVFNTIPEGQAELHLRDRPLDLSLYWTADGATELPLTVFTQLIGPDGVFRGGQDNEPVWGTYPTTDWRPGEQIVDKHLISLQADPPPGEYQVWVGLYDPQTGERVPILDEAGNPAGDHVVLDLKVIVD
jgi:hypothetical protein